MIGSTPFPVRWTRSVPAAALALVVAFGMTGCALFYPYLEGDIYEDAYENGEFFSGGSATISIDGAAPVALEFDPDSSYSDESYDLYFEGDDGWLVNLSVSESAPFSPGYSYASIETPNDAYSADYEEICETETDRSATGISGRMTCDGLEFMTGISGSTKADVVVEFEADF
jgi:hypothetical protein